MKKYKNKKIIIATGGTGGHVFPAYSLAKYLQKNSFSIEVITDERGLRFLKRYKELRLILNNSSTIFKKNFFSIFLSVCLITYSFLKSLFILRKSKPYLVFGMGGYSSFPVCMAARFLGIPFIIYENNLVIGKSNKFLLPFAYKIFLAYSELEGILKKYTHKKVTTGNLLREEILNFKKRKKKSKEKRLNILILGGSQAAKSFGDTLPGILNKCSKEGLKIQVFQQCIVGQEKKIKGEYNSTNIKCRLFNFSKNITEYFSKVDFVITRSGSSIISELLNCNIPFVSIPYPYAADNHQEKNGIYFKNKGYSFLLKENEVKSKLFPLIKLIYKDKEILKRIINNQKKYSDKNVFKEIKSEIEKLINDKN